MRIRNGFKMRTLGPDHIVMAEGAEVVNFNKMIALNPSAAYLWESVEGKEFSVEDLTQLLLDKYEVSREIAAADAAKLAASWTEAGVVEE